MTAADVMRKPEKSALVKVGTSVRDTLYEMSRARSGAAIVVDDELRLLGIFTDGDFRRRATEDRDVLDRQMAEVMTANPVTVKADAMVAEVIKVVENRRIDDLIVIGNDGKVAGFIDIQDLPGLKIM
jgi:arabinose-5-phosphate isomerase